MKIMSVVDLAARKQCLPSSEEQAGDHLDHLGWDAIAAWTLAVQESVYGLAELLNGGLSAKLVHDWERDD